MSAERTVMIESLDDFVRLLQQWHSGQVALLKHFQEIPEGVEITMDDGTPVIIMGEYRKGFIMGIRTALSMVGELPFEAEMVDVPTPPESQEGQPQQASLDLGEPQVH